ncbi:hypothetical protein MJT46_015766 [Ovis ammon polii x Ovis aries]|nr:hypothetical protein MJT46_015766 [Ovis ammon polii x Ovis aries]
MWASRHPEQRTGPGSTLGTEAKGLPLDAALSEPVIEPRYLVQPLPAGRTGLEGEGALGLAPQQSPGAMFPLWDWVLPALLSPADQEPLEVTGTALNPELPARGQGDLKGESALQGPQGTLAGPGDMGAAEGDVFLSSPYGLGVGRPASPHVACRDTRDRAIPDRRRGRVDEQGNRRGHYVHMPTERNEYYEDPKKRYHVQLGNKNCEHIKRPKDADAMMLTEYYNIEGLFA